MTTFIQIIVVLGLISFPIIKSSLNGACEINFVKGFLLGVLYDVNIFQVSSDKKEDKMYRVHVFQFHLGFFNIGMAFSREANDVEPEE